MPDERLQPDLTPPWKSAVRGLAEGFIRKGEVLVLGPAVLRKHMRLVQMP